MYPEEEKSQFETLSNMKVEAEFMQSKAVFVRVYIMEFRNITSVDSSMAADPYMKLYLGGECVNVMIFM